MLFDLPFSTGIFYLLSVVITVATALYAIIRAVSRGELGRKPKSGERE